MELKTAERLENMEEYFLANTIRKYGSASGNNDIINLAVGNPDLAPPKEVIKELTFSAKGKKSHYYQPSAGSEEFRIAAAQWYKRVFGVSLDYRNEVVSIIGSKEGIFHLSLAYLNKGDKIFAPDPGYPIYSHCASLMQSETIHYSLTAGNNWQVDIEELNKKYSPWIKILWLNSPHMPTGSVLTKRSLEQVIEFGLKNNILVVHDNPYSFILNKRKPASILSLKNAKKVAVELCSLSKSFNMPGFRIAIAAGNVNALNAIMKTKSIIDSGSYLPIQMGAVKAFSIDESWFASQNEIYRKRREEVIKLANMLNCTFQPEGSGMFLWGKLPAGVNDKNFVEKLFTQTKVLVTPGSIYGKKGKGYIRISFCQPVQKIKAAEQRIIKQGGFNGYYIKGHCKEERGFSC